MIHRRKHSESRLTVGDVNSMNYTDFIALLRETNRCPGGKDTIRRIASIIDIDEKSKILEIGSNTGFTSLEFARISKAMVHGVDVSRSCVEESKRSLLEDVNGIKKRVKFSLASACDLPFKDNKFDMVMSGGSLGFIKEKKLAINECLRVIRPWGYFVMTPLVYIKHPPRSLIKKVGDILGIEIMENTSKEWIEMVQNISPFFELYYSQDMDINSRKIAEIKNHISYFLKKENLSFLSSEVRKAIEKRWFQHLSVFNQNHRYLGYSIIIFRKRAILEEPELFRVG